MPNRLSIHLRDATLLLTSIVVSGAVFAAAGSASPDRSLRSEGTPTPTSTRNPEPTRTPTPRPEPTRTPEPTKKPEPTATPKPEPTRTPEPTKKPEPTRTPEPTRKPEPTRTPSPTPVPTLSPGSIAFTEPNYSVQENADVATISVRRVVINGRGASGVVSVKYQTTTGGTATAGADYQVVTGTLSWVDGDGSVKKFTVPIIDDSVREPTETVGLRLYDLKGTGTIAPTRQTATLSILDNETGTLDTIKPHVVITSPSYGAHVSDVNTIRGMASDEGGSRLASVVVSIRRSSDNKFWSGTEWVGRGVTLSTELSGNTWVRSSGNPSPSNLSTDFLQISAIANDGAGNKSQAKVQVFVDVTPPSITISSPVPGSHLRSLVRVVGTVSDTEGDASVVLYLRRASDGKYWNGHEWTRSTSLIVQLAASGEWQRTEWPSLDAGKYALSAIATDDVGNTATASAEFSVDAVSGANA